MLKALFKSHRISLLCVGNEYIYKYCVIKLDEMDLCFLKKCGKDYVLKN